MKEIIRPAVILLLITAVAGALLGFVSEVTKEPIALQEEKTRSEAMKAVAPDADEFQILENIDTEGTSISSVYTALKGGEECGYVITVNPSGFGGVVSTMVGFNLEGASTGLKVLSHAETPGLGAKSTEPAFYGQFTTEKQFPLSVLKTGTPSENEILAITSATITSTAVTDGANEAHEWLMNFIGGAK